MACPTKEQLAEAFSRGCDAARAAATWIADGNSDKAAVRATLQGLRDGDPEVSDRIWQAAPNLSGEWADSPTPTSLTREIVGYDVEIYDADFGDIAEAISDEFERGVSETFEAACEAELIAWLGDDAETEV